MPLEKNRDVFQTRLTPRGGDCVRAESAATGRTRSTVLREIVEDWCTRAERREAKKARKAT